MVAPWEIVEQWADVPSRQIASPSQRDQRDQKGPKQGTRMFAVPMSDSATTSRL